jgi:hypothetical protein
MPTDVCGEMVAVVECEYTGDHEAMCDGNVGLCSGLLRSLFIRIRCTLFRTLKIANWARTTERAYGGLLRDLLLGILESRQWGALMSPTCQKGGAGETRKA